MSEQTLQQKLDAAGDIVSFLRNQQTGPNVYPGVPAEYSNWRDEQRGWAKSAVLFNQSYHMVELYVRGPTAALMYWNNREKSRATFQGGWTRSGDKFTQDGDGYYVYAGRSDDMLKVSGMYVSPFEVEAALLTHPDVLEAAVIGAMDEQQLVKPKAYVVIKQGVSGTAALAEALKQHVKDRLAPYKYPRWIDFVAELPRTATGKIQRFKLRN